jgi:hypothetical protein
VGETESLCSAPGYLVRPVLMHMLWRREYTCDLTQPLRPATLLEVTS